MASFQAKTRCDRLRVIQKKKLLFRFIPTRSRIGNCQKIAKKCKNLKKHDYGFISSQNGTGQAENDTKKKMLSFQSIQTQHGKGNSRKIAKKFKKLKKKKSLWPLFKPKRDGTG